MPTNGKPQPDQTFRITLKARMYHAGLLKKQQELGLTQKQMATYLGTNINVLGGMLRMKRIPKFNTAGGKKIKQQLEDMMGMDVSEIFPEHVFTEEFMKFDKTIQVTKDVPQHLLAFAGSVHQLTLPPDEAVMEKEDGTNDPSEAIEAIMSLLTDREKIVIREHYLGDKTLKEVAELLNINHERVRQIENEAISKLQTRMSQAILRRFSRRNDSDDSERSFNNWLSRVVSKNPVLRTRRKG